MHEKSKEHKNLALFDFDGTLCTKDSFTGFIFYALSKRHIIKQGIKILPWIQAYYLKAYPANMMRPRLYKAMFKNTNIVEIENIAQDYVKNLMTHLNPALLHRLEQHQQLGDDVVLVSASIDIYLKFVADSLGIKLICTQTEVKNNQYTGYYKTPDCSSEQKAIRILEQYNLSDYEDVYAYGNSDEDLAMLDLATYSYYVGKDTQLPALEQLKQFA